MRKNKQSIPVPSSALDQKTAKFSPIWYQLQNFWTGSKVTRWRKIKIPQTASVTETYSWTLILFPFIRQKDKHWKKPHQYITLCNFRMPCLRILANENKVIVKIKKVH